jgi:hypothetical protein
MIEFRTTSCHKFGQHEIIMGVEKSADLDPKWLVEYFESSTAQGRRFQPNETVQIGWMLVLLKETESGDLDLWEPQFDSIPISWIKGVNNTLRHLVLQRSVADLFKVNPVYPSIRDAGWASKAFMASAHSAAFAMHRDVPQGNDSGWRISNVSKDHNDGGLRSLFELSFYNMDIVPFLALPPGASVTRDNREIVVTLSGNSITSGRSHFLSELCNSRVWI